MSHWSNLESLSFCLQILLVLVLLFCFLVWQVIFFLSTRTVSSSSDWQLHVSVCCFLIQIFSAPENVFKKEKWGCKTWSSPSFRPTWHNYPLLKGKKCLRRWWQQQRQQQWRRLPLWWPQMVRWRREEVEFSLEFYLKTKGRKWRPGRSSARRRFAAGPLW